MRFVQFLFFKHALEQTTRWTGGPDYKMTGLTWEYMSINVE